MAKGFDFKQFMLQKGERLGFGIALVVMIALIGFGTAEGVANDSPGTTAEWIKSKASDIENRINTGYTEGLIAELEPIFKKGLSFEPVKPEAFAAATPNFFDTPLEINKRLNPVVLTPLEYNAVLVRAALKSMMISPQRDRVQIGVLVPVDRPKNAAPMDPRQKAYIDWLTQRAQMMAAMGMRPPAGVPLPGAPGMGGDATATEYKLEWVDVTKIPPGAEPAEEVKPVRMAVVSASFPYRAQLEMYRSSLRMASLNELAKHEDLLPRFHRFAVQRRTTDTTTGKVKEDWRELNLDQDFKPLLATSVGTEPDGMEIKRLVFPGLVMPRPVLARGAYPEPSLGLIAKTLRVLQEKSGKGGEQAILTPLERQLAGEGLDIFQALSRPDEDKGPRRVPGRQPPGENGAAKEAELVVPDYCLVRFIDVTVKPGYTYDYQIQIRVANPNFGKKTEVAYPPLAEKKELESAWGPEKPVSLTVPRELYVYGTEIDDRTLRSKTSLDPKLLGDKDVTWMQVHRWLETTNLNPEQRGSQVAIGDWSVGDVPVRRGEYIGRPENVKVAMWFPQKRAFDIAVPIQAVTRPGIIGVRPQIIKGIPVNFTTEDLLVDWDGGKISQTFRAPDGKASRDVREDANVEYLIMTPDGKLSMRSSRADKENPERAERFNEWDNWVKQVEAGGGKPADSKGGTRPNIKDPFNRK